MGASWESETQSPSLAGIRNAVKIHLALALVVEEAVGGEVDIAQVSGPEGLCDIAGLVVQSAEVIRLGLNFDTQPFPLDDGGLLDVFVAQAGCLSDIIRAFA